MANPDSAPYQLTYYGRPVEATKQEALAIFRAIEERLTHLGFHVETAAYAGGDFSGVTMHPSLEYVLKQDPLRGFNGDLNIYFPAKPWKRLMHVIMGNPVYERPHWTETYTKREPSWNDVTDGTNVFVCPMDLRKILPGLPRQRPSSN
jgi:hypothetical protein